MKIFYLFFIIGFAGFGEYNGKDKTTKIFAKYLQDEFHIEIPSDLHYFILIPKLACKGCSQSTLFELNSIINIDNCRRFTLISTNDKLIPEELRIKIPLLYDKNGEMDILNLNIANVTIVETIKSKVNYIKPIYADDVHSLKDIIK